MTTVCGPWQCRCFLRWHWRAAWRRWSPRAAWRRASPVVTGRLNAEVGSGSSRISSNDLKLTISIYWYIYIYTYIIYSDSSSSSKLKFLPNGDSFADSRARAYPAYPFAACLVAAAWSLENGKRGSSTSLKTSPEVVKQQTGSQKHVFLVDFQ